MLVTDKDIPRMHIGMEKAVAENLGEEDLHATFGQQFHVRSLIFQRHDIRHGNAVNTLHHHHILAAIVRIHFRHIQHWAVFKVTTQLDGVG
ncbi:hypothetical protein D3C80_1005910 [compost metagenome]